MKKKYPAIKIIDCEKCGDGQVVVLQKYEKAPRETIGRDCKCGQDIITQGVDGYPLCLDMYDEVLFS